MTAIPLTVLSPVDLSNAMPRLTLEMTIVVQADGAATEAVRRLAGRITAAVAAVASDGVIRPRIVVDAPEPSGGRIGRTSYRMRVVPSSARPGLVLRPLHRTALLDGAPVTLTRREYDLLVFLARHPHQVLSRSQLLRDVWGHEAYLGARTIDVHISRLRQKLAGHGPAIGTVRGVGYRLGDVDRLFVVED
ncbi:winged helix-turn-helix domain-containing protein [Micromonospora sp. WMMD737]|uniref:winged helix-turn-helix domain-containing protein n=1 Tax=Micromonospora sp. WMMD737 TaxID=3404113 RepID=UPI003B928CA3